MPHAPWPLLDTRSQRPNPASPWLARGRRRHGSSRLHQPGDSGAESWGRFRGAPGSADAEAKAEPLGATRSIVCHPARMGTPDPEKGQRRGARAGGRRSPPESGGRGPPDMEGRGRRASGAQNLMAFRRQPARILSCLSSQTLKGKTPSHIRTATVKKQKNKTRRKPADDRRWRERGGSGTAHSAGGHVQCHGCRSSRS